MPSTATRSWKPGVLVLVLVLDDSAIVKEFATERHTADAHIHVKTLELAHVATTCTLEEILEDDQFSRERLMVFLQNVW